MVECVHEPYPFCGDQNAHIELWRCSKDWTDKVRAGHVAIGIANGWLVVEVWDKDPKAAGAKPIATHHLRRLEEI